jgi:hypothetical protein
MSEQLEEQAITAVSPPFKALIAAWSLIFVVLSVAGYSFRWNYYYNFGLQSLVFGAPLDSLPVYAIEIVRNPAAIAHLIVLALIYLLPFQLLLIALQAMRKTRRKHLRSGGEFIVRVLGLDNRLVVEGMVAALIIIIAFRAGGDAGYQAYIRNVVEGRSNLPRVTAIARAGSSDSPLPITCDTHTFKDAAPSVSFLGEPEAVADLRSGTTCSTRQTSWRLLLRDEKFVYLFATVQNENLRPQTLILPNSDRFILVFR